MGGPCPCRYARRRPALALGIDLKGRRALEDAATSFPHMEGGSRQGARQAPRASADRDARRVLDAALRARAQPRRSGQGSGTRVRCDAAAAGMVGTGYMITLTPCDRKALDAVERGEVVRIYRREGNVLKGPK